MILDNQAIYSDKQAITTEVLAPSTNILDHGDTADTGYGGVKLKHNFGNACIPLLLQVNEDFAGAAATALNVKFQTSDDATFATGVENVLEVIFPLAILKAGNILPVDKFPRNIRKRYTRIAYQAVGDDFTAGKITAAVVAAVDNSYQG